MEVITILRKEYPVTVLKMQIKDLDPTKCSYKFRENQLSPEEYVFVRCESDGTIELKGNRKHYSLYPCDERHKPLSSVII